MKLLYPSLEILEMLLHVSVPGGRYAPSPSSPPYAIPALLPAFSHPPRAPRAPRLIPSSSDIYIYV